MKKHLSQEHAKKSAIPNDHWERHYDRCAPSENMVLTEGADFNPKNSTFRKTTYLKVNEQDH